MAQYLTNCKKDKKSYDTLIKWINTLLKQIENDATFSRREDFRKDLKQITLGLNENIDSNVLGKLPFSLFFRIEEESIAFNYYKAVTLNEDKKVLAFEEHTVVLPLDLNKLYMIKRNKQVKETFYEIICYSKENEKTNPKVKKLEFKKLQDDGSFDFISSENIEKNNLEESIKRIFLMINA